MNQNRKSQIKLDTFPQAHPDGRKDDMPIRDITSSLPFFVATFCALLSARMRDVAAKAAGIDQVKMRSS